MVWPGKNNDTTLLYRPVGQQELDLIRGERLSSIPAQAP